jgi:hypothetical protein
MTTTPTVPRTEMTSYCRNGSHKSCQDVGFKCRCECHGPNGQQPKPTPVPPAASAARQLKSVPAPTPASDGPPEGFVWEAPPASRSRLPFQVPAEVLDVLKANPGRWARVLTRKGNSTTSSIAQRINGTDKGRTFTLGRGWEAKGRRDTATGGSVLYLRWVGTSGSGGAA